MTIELRLKYISSYLDLINLEKAFLEPEVCFKD